MSSTCSSAALEYTKPTSIKIIYSEVVSPIHVSPPCACGRQCNGAESSGIVGCDGDGALGGQSGGDNGPGNGDTGDGDGDSGCGNRWSAW